MHLSTEWGAWNRKLGLIFSEWNTNFDTFLVDHECNKFCKFYHLLPLPVPPNDEGSLNQKAAGPQVPSDLDDDSLVEFPDSVLPQVTQNKKNGKQGMSTDNINMLWCKFISTTHYLHDNT